MAKVTREEKVAKVLVYAVNDFTLDLDLVGEYVAEFSTYVLLNRLDTVLDSAKEARDGYAYTRAEHEERGRLLGRART